MKRAFQQVKKYWLINLITLAISLVIGGAIFCLAFFLKERNIVSAVNAAAISSVSILCIGLLLWMSHLGAFDTFAFGFKQLGTSMFGKKGNETKDFAGYKEQNRIKREEQPKIFLPILIAGLVFLLAMIVLRIIGY